MYIYLFIYKLCIDANTLTKTQNGKKIIKQHLRHFYLLTANSSVLTNINLKIVKCLNRLLSFLGILVENLHQSAVSFQLCMCVL